MKGRGVQGSGRVRQCAWFLASSGELDVNWVLNQSTAEVCTKHMRTDDILLVVVCAYYMKTDSLVL